MRVTRTMRPSAPAPRGSAWAAGLTARHRRRADAPWRELLLHLRRMPTPLLQRWLSFHADVRMLFNIHAGRRETPAVARPWLLARAAPVAQRNPGARSVRPARAPQRAAPPARPWHVPPPAPPPGPPPLPPPL